MLEPTYLQLYRKLLWEILTVIHPNKYGLWSNFTENFFLDFYVLDYLCGDDDLLELDSWNSLGLACLPHHSKYDNYRGIIWIPAVGYFDLWPWIPSPSDHGVRIMFLPTSIMKEYVQHGWLENLDRATSIHSISVLIKIWPWLVSSSYPFCLLYVYVCTHMPPCVLHSECWIIFKVSLFILYKRENLVITQHSSFFCHILSHNYWMYDLSIWYSFEFWIKAEQGKLIQGVNILRS